jgi:hypothetical protein
MATLDEFVLGKWSRLTTPFAHFRAEELLSPASYGAIASAFAEILNATDNDGAGRYKLRRSAENYDARMLAMDWQIADMFGPLFKIDWIKWLSEICEVPFLGRVDAALHSSPSGSRTGWIHTDLCSGWFDESYHDNGGRDDLLFPDRSRCDYFTGRSRKPGSRPVEYVRAATAIIYLCNDNWSQGDGGETALYASAKGSDVSLIPPINNSALVFKCSPHSHHRFIRNPGRCRNSIIFWLHTTVDYATSEWGTAVNRRTGK